MMVLEVFSVYTGSLFTPTGSEEVVFAAVNYTAVLMILSPVGFSHIPFLYLKNGGALKR